MAAVKSGRSQTKGSKRRKAAPARVNRRWPLMLLGSGVVVAAIVGAGAFGLRSSAGEAINQLAYDLSDAGLRGLGLTVQDVTVSGRRNAPSHEILGALRVDRGVSMLAFDAKRARARVLDVDWVEEATVTRLLPDTIHVTISEHEPFAVWQKSGRNYVVDLKGETITEASPSVMAKLPLLAGKGAPLAAPKLLAMLAKRPEISAKVRAAVRVGDRRWTLKLSDGIDVMLPAAGVGAALDELLQLDSGSDLLARDIRVVDLRNPDRLTVRLRDDGQASDSGDNNS